MAVPTSITLQVARTQAEKMLTATATRYVRTDTIEASGSSSVTYVLQASPTLPCLVSLAVGGKKVASEIGEIGGAEADIASHIIRFKNDATLVIGDKVTIGSESFYILEQGNSDTNKILLLAGAVRVK